MPEIAFYYDFGSPNVYFVDSVLPSIAGKHGATIVYKPMLLGGVFKATNNQAPMMAFADVSHKLDYMRLEIDRFIRRYDVAFTFNPHFPVMTVATMRGAVFAQGKTWENDYIATTMEAFWQRGLKMDDPEVMANTLERAGLPSTEIMTAIQSPEIKSGLMERTTEAVENKVFGAPTMFVGTEMFFGKDALDDLDWYLGTL